MPGPMRAMLLDGDEEETPARAPGNKKGGCGKSGTLVVGGSSQVRLQYDCPKAGTHTVQINSDGPNGSDAIASITFSVDGNTDVERQCNVGQGVSVTGVADSIVVQIRDDSDVNNVAAEDQQDEYDIDISFAPGPRATSQIGPTLVGAIRTKVDFFGSPDNPSGQMSFPIPQKVGVTSVLVLVNSENGTTPAKALVQLNNPVGPVASYDPNVQQGFQPFVITPQAVLVTNQLAATAVYVTIIFGIDG